MNINTVLDLFLASCRLRGLADRTIDCYYEFVNKFIKQYPNLKIENLNMNIIADYIEYLYGTGVSRSSIATYLRHLKVFIRWLEDEEYILKFSDKIRIPKTPKKIVRIYSDDEIRQIFANINFSVDWLRLRNSAIVALMIDSGLRQNEVCQVGLDDLQLRDSFIKVHGKGNKERIVPVGKLSLHYIMSYLKLRPYNNDKLFVTVTGSDLTRNSVKLMIRKLSKVLPFEFSSHKLRHNFATNYCLDQYEKHGHIDIYKLMVLLGHEDIKTTRRYLHMANQLIASKNNISHIDKVMLGRQ